MPEAKETIEAAQQPVEALDPVQERASVVVDLNATEIWEAATDATTWIWLEDRTTGNGAWRQERVGGKARRRIHLTVKERRYNQDQIPEENLQHDPFSNGQLLCVQGAARGINQFTDDQIIELLGIEGDEVFEQAINGIQSEVLLRRILNLAQRNASNLRFEFVREAVDTRFRVGGTQRSIREMQRAGELSGGEFLSS